MFATKEKYISNIISLTTPAEPRPGEHITYKRDGRIISGILLGSITMEVKRFMIDGKHPIVVEYVIAPDVGQSNLSAHLVPEQDIAWSKVGQS